MIGIRGRNCIPSYIRLGLSGCKLEFISDDVIRKTSQSTEYNQRFEKQIHKQQQFFGVKLNNISTPKILNVGYEKGLLYCDMQYIDSSIFTEKFQHSTFNDITYYTKTLFNYVDTIRFTNESYTSDEIKSCVVAKLEQLKPKSKYSDLIVNVLEHTKHIDFGEVEKNNCHGDLTLSNILFTNRDIYFIDFLDSYVESFLIDLVKIKQDLYYKWNIKLMNSYLPKVEFYMNKMWGDFEKKYDKHIDTELFHVLDLINYLRIEPYISTHNQFFTLDETIKSTHLYQLYKQN